MFCLAYMNFFLQLLIKKMWIAGWIGAGAHSDEWARRVVEDDGVSVPEEQILRGGGRPGGRAAGARGEQRLRAPRRCARLQGVGCLQEEKRHRARHLPLEVHCPPHLLARGLPTTSACCHLVAGTSDNISLKKQDLIDMSSGGTVH
jgi:hypothetical protein